MRSPAAYTCFVTAVTLDRVGAWQIEHREALWRLREDDEGDFVQAILITGLWSSRWRDGRGFVARLLGISVLRDVSIRLRNVLPIGLLGRALYFALRRAVQRNVCFNVLRSTKHFCPKLRRYRGRGGAITGMAERSTAIVMNNSSHLISFMGINIHTHRHQPLARPASPSHLPSPDSTKPSLPKQPQRPHQHLTSSSLRTPSSAVPSSPSPANSTSTPSPTSPSSSGARLYSARSPGH